MIARERVLGSAKRGHLKMWISDVRYFICCMFFGQIGQYYSNHRNYEFYMEIYGTTSTIERKHAETDVN